MISINTHYKPIRLAIDCSQLKLWTTGRESAGPELPPAASLQLCTQSACRASPCSCWYRVHVAYSAPSVVEWETLMARHCVTVEYSWPIYCAAYCTSTPGCYIILPPVPSRGLTQRRKIVSLRLALCLRLCVMTSCQSIEFFDTDSCEEAFDAVRKFEDRN